MLIIIPNILVSNYRDFEVLFDENNTYEDFTQQPPKESFVYYEPTTDEARGAYVSGDYDKEIDNPIITSAPSDFFVDFGYTGVIISWTATDANPDTYTIELQGTDVVAGPSAWTSGVAIIYNVPDGLGLGDYIYTVNFTDDYDNYITDSVTMTVKDFDDPIITSAPSDFTVEFGYTGVSISWTVTDANPNTYTIELQGTGVVIGPSAWTSGVAITYNIPDGLGVGDYIYTVNFTDDCDNFITDTATITVKDFDDPIITSAPSDFIVEFGYTGVIISWTATDANPNTYTIELQGTGVVAGPSAWTSGVAITYNIPDGLSSGVYTYKITFYDESNNLVSDTVIFTVEDTGDGVGPAIPFSNYYLIFLVIGIIYLAIIQKRRKLKIN